MCAIIRGDRHLGSKLFILLPAGHGTGPGALRLGGGRGEWLPGPSAIQAQSGEPWGEKGQGSLGSSIKTLGLSAELQLLQQPLW